MGLKVMNKHWYNYGNTFKVKFRNHYCFRCSEKLIIVKHRKVVDQNSKEAKYYDFDTGGDGAIMVGPCEFIHKVFYCPKCSQNIEFITQINQEDIETIITKVTNYFGKRNRKVFISKSYETKYGELLDNKFHFDDDIILCLNISEDNKSKVYKIPVLRRKFWERPYYFDVSKKKLINFIK